MEIDAQPGTAAEGGKDEPGKRHVELQKPDIESGIEKQTVSTKLETSTEVEIPLEIDLASDSGAHSDISETSNVYRQSDVIPETPRSTIHTCIGKIQSWHSLSKCEVLFLVVSLVGITSVFCLSIERLAREPTHIDITFGIIVIINSCFCLYYLLSGVLLERKYELGVLVLSTAVLWFYIIFHYAMHSKRGYSVLIRLIAASIISPCIIIVGIILIKEYHESGNLTFRTVGAQGNFIRMCENMFLFYSVLKGDLQISITAALLILMSSLKLCFEDEIILPLVLVTAVAGSFLGYFTVRFENRYMVGLYCVLWLFQPAYDIYLFIKATKYFLPLNTKMTPGAKITVGITLTTISISLLLRVVLLVVGIKVVMNFGKGLKKKVYGTGEDKRDSEHFADDDELGDEDEVEDEVATVQQ